MKILGLDYETTGNKNDPPFLPTELAFAMLDVNNFRITQAESHLVNPEVNVREFFLKYANVSPDQLAEGISREESIRRLSKAAEAADCMMTWNGEDFDKELIFQECREFGVPFPELPWIDLKVDGGFNGIIKYTAADLGFLARDSHTGLADVLDMFEILKRSGLDVFELFRLSAEPVITIAANISKADRQLAKDQGFYWDNQNYQWRRKVRKGSLCGDEKNLMFRNLSVQVVA